MANQANETNGYGESPHTTADIGNLHAIFCTSDFPGLNPIYTLDLLVSILLLTPDFPDC